MTTVSKKRNSKDWWGLVGAGPGKDMLFEVFNHKKRKFTHLG